LEEAAHVTPAAQIGCMSGISEVTFYYCLVWYHGLTLDPNLLKNSANDARQQALI